MKKLFLLFLLAVTSGAVRAQSFVNPDTIQQKGDIILQNTDVYYHPFAPPSDSDTRVNLCNESDLLRNPDGAVANRSYAPMIYDADSSGFIPLANWSPCGAGRALGPYVVWQRLFQAMNKPDGLPSNIIAGGGASGTRVTVSKNEDVDFRATGRIELKSGFHVKGGAFFHAYTEPKWDTAVFSDEFDSGAKFNNQWYVYNGSGEDLYPPQCDFDSNVYLDTDYQAHDGHALDIAYRENLDTCSCDSLSPINIDSCVGDIDYNLLTHLPRVRRSLASSGMIRGCPFPYAPTGSALGPAYAHTPYGKYEVREKIPRMPQHTNNWGSGPQNMEWDLDERINACMGLAYVGWGHGLSFGPYTGSFNISGGDTLFICHNAGWGTYNIPSWIMINNITYDIFPFDITNRYYVKDTVRAGQVTEAMGGFPTALLNLPGQTFSFYYAWYPWHSSDSVTWRVDTDSHGTYRIFSAPYEIPSIGDSIFFTKNFQPNALQLRDSVTPTGDTVTKKYHCHWRDSLNEPTNKGLVWLDDTLSPADLRTHKERFSYQTADQYNTGFGYPVPPVLVDPDTTNDSVHLAAYGAEPYQYHTYAMEFLPHEVLILFDSVVVRRFPDRLIPRASPYYDWVSTFARGPVTFFPGEFDPDDVVASPSGDATMERKFFEAHPPTGGGFWDVNGQPAAHHMLDYVKVWDVPKDVKIPAFPQ